MPSFLSPAAPRIDTARHFYNLSIRTKRNQWLVNLIINRDKTKSGPDFQFSLLDQYMKPWERAYPISKVRKVPSIESALELAKKIRAQEDATHVLITGSLHVVGEALRLLGR